MSLRAWREPRARRTFAKSGWIEIQQTHVVAIGNESNRCNEATVIVGEEENEPIARRTQPDENGVLTTLRLDERVIFVEYKRIALVPLLIVCNSITTANGIEFVLIRFLASARETLIGGDVLERR